MVARLSERVYGRAESLLVEEFDVTWDFQQLVEMRAAQMAEAAKATEEPPAEGDPEAQAQAEMTDGD